MEATFNPRTSYAEEWRYMDLIDDAVLRKRTGANDGNDINGKANRHTPNSKDWSFYASALGITSETDIAQFWPLVADGEAPEIDDLLVIDNVNYVITNIVAMEYGPGWTFGITKASDQG